MNPRDLQTLKTWFAEYCASFATSVADDQRNYDVKQQHTAEVCANSVLIARELGMSEQDLLLAEAIGLFHDLGRFPQYRDYRTFNDSVSANHAALGARVLLEEGVLNMLPKPEQHMIVRSVALHNVFTLPTDLDDRSLQFVKIIRDADKLDIWRVFIEYYAKEKTDQASAVALGLPDNGNWSDKALAALKSGSMVNKNVLASLNDFKLLQLSWAYDLNFPVSFRLMQERGIIDKLESVLPADSGIKEAVACVRAYVGDRVNNGYHPPTPS
jgi:putative nucleotidyltransferase with HDIG domain